MKKLLLFCSFFCLVSTITMAQSSKKKTQTSKVQSKKPAQRKKSNVAIAKKKPGYLAYNSKKKKTSSKRSRSSASRSIASFAANPKKSTVQLSAEDQMISTDFAKSRGKLPWPVAGTVSIPFGDYEIDETTIKGRNPGITISTSDKNMPVKAVFDGVIADVDGNDELATVYIRHGNYYTVYSNLSAIHVKKGALVKMGEAIGSVGEAYSDNGGGELMFVVMAETDNVNPEKWLKK
jgi:murein hydrolase activator